MPCSPKPSGRATHGAPPEPLSTTVSPWLSDVRLYTPASVLAMVCLTSSSEPYTAAKCFNPGVLSHCLTKFPFVHAVMIKEAPHVTAGIEYAKLANQYDVEAILVNLITLQTQADLDHLFFLLTIGPGLPGAQDRSAAAIYEAVRETLNCKSKKSRFFIDGTSEIAAARTVMYDKTAYKVRSQRNKQINKDSTI